jgi:hypothetical protein
MLYYKRDKNKIEVEADDECVLAISVIFKVDEFV